MAATDQRVVAVCDAGPLIHLDELASLDLLAEFTIWVPDAVWTEVSRHRPGSLQYPTILCLRRVPFQPTPPWLTALKTALLLDRGESEGLMLMVEAPHAFFFTDDSAARLAAQQLGYRVHGTIGILLRSIRRGQRTAGEVVTILENLPSRSSLYLRPSLLRDVIAEIEARYHLE